MPTLQASSTRPAKSEPVSAMNDHSRNRYLHVGAAFAVPLKDGRYGAVRILRVDEEDHRTTALVAVTPWLAATPPDLSAPALKEVLRLHRGRFGGRPALCWYDGIPPAELLYIGVVLPTEEDLRLDPQGAYCGRWTVTVAQDVVLESATPLQAANSRASMRTQSLPEGDPLVGEMDDDEFWALIELLDRSSGDGFEAVEPLIQQLAAKSPSKIAGFHEVLMAKLSALDREDIAREIGAHAYGSTEGFSPDHFMDVRAAIVASGRALFESVLEDPRHVPKDGELEALVTVAEEAYRRRTGRTPVFVASRSAETFSSLAGWTRSP
jgi:hypothetical protein